MIQQTSIYSYLQLLSSCELGKRQQDVLNVLRVVGVANNRQIAQALNVDCCSITPRVLELRKMGFISLVGVDACPITHKKVMFWRIK